MNVIITGGLQGIGRALVCAYQAAGHSVFVFDIGQQGQEEAFGYATVDVSERQQVLEGFAAAKAYFVARGSDRLDVLINNAGITRDGLAVRMQEVDWDRVLDVNAKGAFLCSQQAIKAMMGQGAGYIVNIASLVGITGNAGQANYAASKAAVIGLTKSLAQEYGPKNILVNAIAPGFIETAMTAKLSPEARARALAAIPLRRAGAAEDVAHVAVFLTSGRADYISGQVISVNGGMV